MAEVEQPLPITASGPPGVQPDKGEITIIPVTASNEISTETAEMPSPQPGMVKHHPPLQHQNSVGSLVSPDSPMPQDSVHDLPEELLQMGWRKFWSRREQRPYFFNKITNESLWDMPQLFAKMSGPLKDYNFQERSKGKHIKNVVMTERQNPVETLNFPKLSNDTNAHTKPRGFQQDDAKNFRDVSKTNMLQNPGPNVHKISLQEYRDRVKSKSPSKQDSTDVNEIDSSDNGKTFNPVRKDQPRSGRAMSTDDIPVADMSLDLANMSINNTEDDNVTTTDNGKNRNIQSNAGIGQKVDLQNREKTISLVTVRDRDSVEKHSQENRLKLKKAVSSSQCSSQSGQGLTSSSKSYGSLPSSSKPDNTDKSSKSGAVELNKAETKGRETDAMTRTSSNSSSKPKEAMSIHLSLADRLKLKAAGVKVTVNGKEDNPSVNEKYRLGSGTSSQSGSQSEVIDLTEDEESPEPVNPKQKSTTLQDPVKPKQPSVNISLSLKSKQTNSPLFEPFKPPQTSSKISESVKPKQPISNVPGATDRNQTSASLKQFGQNQNVKMSSFQSLSSQSSIKPTNLMQTGEKGSSKDWTEIRGQTGATGSGNQSHSSTFKLTSDKLKESLQEEINRRNQLTKLLEKQKSICLGVKLSELPDNGQKLLAQIENISRLIRESNIKISTKSSQLNALNKSAQDQGPQKQPQVIKIYPNRTTEIKKEGQSVVGGNHVPHNPDNLRQTSLLPHVANIPPHILQQMYAANPQAMTLYGGRMTAARLREVGSLTKEAIEKLHKQLETCPKDTEELEDPGGLLVSLMTHQRQALTWLVWRERQSPSGGILADDMGLGKTLTMIALIIKQRELRKTGTEEEKNLWLNRDKQLEKLDKSIIKSNATMIICPASLIHHWRTEIERRCETGLLKICMYHGPNREKNLIKLAKYDVVLTTYNIVGKEVGAPEGDKNGEEPVKDDESEEKPDSDTQKVKDQPTLMRIAWERIILDEAHNIKNHKALCSRAVVRLRAGFRWALTGTPIQNDLLDMYSLLRFLRCSPFDEYKVWKKQVDTGSSTGQNRLNVLVKTLLLRRTKSQTCSKGKPLVPLPEKTSMTHDLHLSPEEQRVYDKIFSQSRSVLKEYLKRQEEKEMLKDGYTSNKPISNPFTDKPHPSQATASAIGSSNQVGVSLATKAANGDEAPPRAQQILVMLLRLRQCCCHLSLMKDALDDETQENEGLELTLEEQMMDLLLDDNQTKEPTIKKSSPLFEPGSASTKMSALLKELTSIHHQAESKCKSVIVSQWTKMLDIVAIHLKKMNITCHVIQGNIPAKKRMEFVDLFNNDPAGPEVMLVSLRAGGCGLNLIGGNHLFLLDSHWNPALEDQACDRIYRVGQKKNVYIHRFLCKDTVEEKILELQKRKLTLAKNVLTGDKASNTKLTLADLRELFGV